MFLVEVCRDDLPHEPCVCQRDWWDGWATKKNGLTFHWSVVVFIGILISWFLIIPIKLDRPPSSRSWLVAYLEDSPRYPKWLATLIYKPFWPFRRYLEGVRQPDLWGTCWPWLATTYPSPRMILQVHYEGLVGWNPWSFLHVSHVIPVVTGMLGAHTQTNTILTTFEGFTPPKSNINNI